MLEIFYCFHNIVFTTLSIMYLICENDTWKSEKYVSTSNKFSSFQIFRFLDSTCFFPFLCVLNLSCLCDLS